MATTPQKPTSTPEGDPQVDGKPEAGSQLTRRVERNSAATEKAQRNADTGAHSDKPDRSNP